MADSEYNFSSKILHRIALQSNLIAEVSFDVDNAIARKKGVDFSDEPVFISGLARSGTTMLMRYLYESGQFRSLTYQDMPFVLMPNLWKKLFNRKPAGESKERAHRDGIMVSFESPEAFEEVFWRVFSGSDYIRKDRLILQKRDSDLLKKFREYVHNVILSADDHGQVRYLSKNNNNILRLPYLYDSFPGAKVVIPFRHPLQHAASLLGQHKHFSKMQSSDKFSLQYMNWLGHFEFGLNQKPFYFEDSETFKKMENCDKGDLDFWLLSWKNYYSYALENGNERTLFFCYEDFCEAPSEVLGNLFKKLDVRNIPSGLGRFVPSGKETGGFNAELLDECMEIYLGLEARFKLWHT